MGILNIDSIRFGSVGISNRDRQAIFRIWACNSFMRVVAPISNAYLEFTQRLRLGKVPSGALGYVCADIHTLILFSGRLNSATGLDPDCKHMNTRTHPKGSYSTPKFAQIPSLSVTYFTRAARYSGRIKLNRAHIRNTHNTQS